MTLRQRNPRGIGEGLFDLAHIHAAINVVEHLAFAAEHQKLWHRAAQVELLINRVGVLMVLLLTRVLGRAIGLVGRGVMQGLGQGLQNAPSSGEQRS